MPNRRWIATCLLAVLVILGAAAPARADSVTADLDSHLRDIAQAAQELTHIDGELAGARVALETMRAEVGERRDRLRQWGVTLYVSGRSADPVASGLQESALGEYRRAVQGARAAGERVRGVQETRSSTERKLQASRSSYQTLLVDVIRRQQILRAEAAATTGGIGSVALGAYVSAQYRMALEQPECHLSGAVLAGIGKAESNHGRLLAEDGTAIDAIIGVALDGTGGNAAVRDTDGGRLDGDTVWDRAIGPFQFLSTYWGSAGRDGNGDGRVDAQNIHDAAWSAAVKLCSSGDLSDPAVLRGALHAYNRSWVYVDRVIELARAYADERLGLWALES